jgi:hypothetical protein
LAEIVPVVSETLEATVRSLLPSQRGFGQDLQASNVIVPVIDLTPAAEGTSIQEYLQTALAFGNQEVFYANNGNDVIANTPGFWRVNASFTCNADGTFDQAGYIEMSDGLSTKRILSVYINNATSDTIISETLDKVIFLRAGDTLTAVSGGAKVFVTGSARQLADVNGNLVQPSGFTPQ